MNKADLSERKIFVMGYWQLRDNKKRTPSHYSMYLPETLRMIAGHKMVLFYDDQSVYDLVYRECKTNNISCQYISIPIEKLPSYRMAGAYVETLKKFSKLSSSQVYIKNPKEKAREHLLRDYGEGGQDVYLGMLSIWLSKIPLVAGLARESSGTVSNYAWIDASLSRFCGTRDWSDVSRLKDIPGKLTYYRGKRSKKFRKLAANASYISGSSVVWASVAETYNSIMINQSLEMYPNDEETILDELISMAPDLFYLINPKSNRMLYKIKKKLGIGMYLK